MPSLADILKAEADLASAFVIVLEEEQEVLKTGNPDALPSLAERKSTLAGQLNPPGTSTATAHWQAKASPVTAPASKAG